MKMIEKIKVSVPQRICELLHRDARDFRILKPSGEENLNAFINLLVVNFYEEFSADDMILRESIQNALSTIPEKYADAVFPEIMNAIGKRERGGERTKSVALSFKPTSTTEGIFIYIDNVLLKNESLSSFYRRMFLSYAKKTKNERERIIHKPVFELLVSAMDKGMQVCISLANGQIYNDVSVYAIEPAKEELFYYALLYSQNKNRTVRLAKIKTVSLLTKTAHIPDEAKQLFDRQIACGAQYPIYATFDEVVKVQLTEKGKALFDKIYLYRPIPIAIEGDIYTFDCSPYQVIYYFERFGAEALILSPKKHGIFMRNYYYFALKKYRSIYGKD